MGLPPADLTPLVIPLAGVEVVDNVATVTLTLASVPDDGYCLDRLNPINLINGSISFAGAEAVPTTVADFLTLPVSADDRRITLTGQAPNAEQTVLSLDPGVQFGSLQTVFDGRRTLLIATSNGAPAQLDELLGWLDADRGRWSQLRGSAIVAIAGRAPALVAGRTPASVYGPVAPTPDQAAASPAGSYHYDRAWWVAAGVVGVAAVGVAAIILTSRRPRDNSATHRRDD